MSSLFLRTLREDPVDAEVASHRLLQRAGYVRRVAPGIFTWLPLGLRTFHRVENIVREEMDRAGFQEVHFPALLPREPYELTGRWEEYGDTLFRLQDRRENDYLLGPTHEEMFTLTVKGECSSYKDLPISLYQIQTKYRDEARPRAGLLRGREFVMKDSYSFDLDEEGLAKSYQTHRDAYIATFDRLGLDYVIVSATSGAMGGSMSEEFLAPCEAGEDTFVQCPDCGYAANTEAVTTPIPELIVGEHPAVAEIHTPGATSINGLIEQLAQAEVPVAAEQTLKNLVYVVMSPDGQESPLVIGVPGDRAVDEKRLEAALAPRQARPFTDADFAAHPQLIPGFIGPQILADLGIEYLVDPRIAPGTSWVTGANKVDYHVTGVMPGRDFTPDGRIEAAEIREGDLCPNCGVGLQIRRGIEIGHIFQLGTKYADALGLQVLDESGELRTVHMGSYGIGVSRAVAAMAEQTCDDKGLSWPVSVAPARAYVVILGKKPELIAQAEGVLADLDQQGISLLVDDRQGVSAGVKFNDAELIGLPTIVILGRGLADGKAEVQDRRSGERQEVALTELAGLLQ